MNYKFGFILSTLLGNQTRFLNLQKYSTKVRDVECIWAPVRHYYLPEERDPVRLLPKLLHTRAVPVAQAWPVLRDLNSCDAVLVHQYEVLSLLAVRSSIKKDPIIIAAQDAPPVLDPSNYPLYQEYLEKSSIRREVRLKVDVGTLKMVDYFLGFSEWSADIVRQCGLRADHVAHRHVGIDLELWRMRSDRPPNAKVRILFVGGDFHRKGGDKLVKIFADRLIGRCELDIVTATELGTLPEGVRVHYGLKPNDPLLARLFQSADLFVLPTEADFSSWVVLEAMASGCAVATSRVGGIPDLVTPETAVLFDANDKRDISNAVESLVNDPDRCRAMGIAGRRHVEERFDASKNVPLIFDQMKAWVDERRALRS